MELIAFASGKGGTGKTLTASCLGYALIRAGLRVLMVDADPATDGLSLFLLGRDGMRQISAFEQRNTFTGILQHFQQTGNLDWEAHIIHREGSDSRGDHGVPYQAIISGKGLYGDATSALVVPDLDQDGFRNAVRQLFAAIQATNQYDYVIVDTRGGFAFESTDVCALTDSFIVVTEPDITSFYQDRNLVRRISEAAVQLKTKPLLRSFIVNKANEAEFTGDNLDLDNVEKSFRLEISKEFPLQYSDTYPVPLDLDAVKAYKTQRIPYLAAPASLFSFATLSAYRGILRIVTARWSEAQAKKWDELVESVSDAIAAKNEKLKADRLRQAEQEKLVAQLEASNKELQERAASLTKEMERLESRYERELQRSTVLFSKATTPPISSSSVPQTSSPSPAPVASSDATQISIPTPPPVARPIPAPSSAPPVGVATVASRPASRIWALLSALLVVVGLGAYGWWWAEDSPRAMLRKAYDQSLPLATRVAYVGELIESNSKNFDGITLAGADLSGLVVEGASFRSAKLESARFRGADMPGCDFSGADLRGADFSGAKLNDCTVDNADFTGANVDRADFTYVDKSKAKGLPAEQPVGPAAVAPATHVAPTSGTGRPAGGTGSVSPDKDIPVVPVAPPQSPGQTFTVFDNWNTAGVDNNPSRPTRFRTTQSYYLTSIATYHWNNGRGDPGPGFISLKRIDGPAQFPGWPITALEGAAQNVNWVCAPNEVIPPGTYQVIDSAPATWSRNAGSGNRGFVRITGYVK